MIAKRGGSGAWGVLPRWQRARVAGALSASIWTAACGGTNGREGIPVESADANPEMLDATMGPGDAGLDATTVDVTILYADEGRLPVFEAGPDTGGVEAGHPWDNWPACACDVLDPDTATGVDSVDSGVCAAPDVVGNQAFLWTGSARCEECVRNPDFGCSDPIPTGDVFPPCCDLRGKDGGPDPVAASGPAAGQSEFQLCAALWTCLVDNGALVKAHPYQYYFCGPHYDCSQGANGPCAKETFDAFQLTDTSRSYILTNLLIQSIPSIYAGAEAYAVTTCIGNLCGAQNDCSAGDAGGSDGGSL